MNYCSNCGKKNEDNSNFCPECGKQLIESEQSKAAEKSESKTANSENTNSLAVAGFITALVSLLINFWGIVGIVATILSGTAIPRTGPGKEKGRGMAIAGLIIGIFSVLYGLAMIINLSNPFY